MSYSNPISATYRFAAADISTAATLARIVGPAGKQGRLVDICSIVTTGVTVAASTVTLGSGSDADAYGTLTVAVSSANAAQNGATAGVTNTIPANDVVILATGGESTAGAADIIVMIDWY